MRAREAWDAGRLPLTLLESLLGSRGAAWVDGAGSPATNQAFRSSPIPDAECETELLVHQRQGSRTWQSAHRRGPARRRDVLEDSSRRAAPC